MPGILLQFGNLKIRASCPPKGCFYFLPINSTASEAAIAESALKAGIFGAAVVSACVGFAVVAADVIISSPVISTTNPLSKPPLP